MECDRCGAALPASGGACPSCGYRPPPRRRHIIAAFSIVGVLLIALAAGVAAARFDVFTVSVAGRAVAASSPAAPSPEPLDSGTLFTHVATGVVPITSVACGEGVTGSAFFIDDRTLVTAAHVVRDSVSVTAQVDGVPRTAEVTGIDESADLAVLEVNTATSGAVLALATSEVATDEKVAALGYPEGAALRLTEGRVVAVDQTVTAEGQQLDDVIESTAEARHGNSGGPLVNAQGEVVGIVVAGHENGTPSFAVNARGLRARIDALPAPPEPSCDQPPLGPDETADFPAETLTDQVAATFSAYFDGINSGDYAMAYQQLSPRLATPDGLDAFAEGVSTSYDFLFEVRDADIRPDRARVWLEFTSLQDPSHGPDGEPCTQWSLDYHLIRVGGQFLIDRVTGHNGEPTHQPCA